MSKRRIREMEGLIAQLEKALAINPQDDYFSRRLLELRKEKEELESGLFKKTIDFDFKKIRSFAFQIAAILLLTIVLFTGIPKFIGFAVLDVTQNSPALNSTRGTNTTAENLTSYPQVTSGTALYNITDWRLQNRSIALLDMPFEPQHVPANDSQLILAMYFENQNGTISNSTTTQDASSYNNTGNASAIFNITGGRIGSAYTFNGSSTFIRIPDSNMFDLKSYTLEAWIKSTSTQTEQRIVSQQDSGFWVMSMESGTLRFCDSFELSCQTSTQSTLNNGSWHHVAVIKNETGSVTTYHWYIDGTLVKSVSGTDQSTHSRAADVWIGRLDVFTEYFNGTIDEVMVWNRSLKNEEIKNHYLLGSRVRDYSLYGNNATLNQTNATGDTDPFFNATGGKVGGAYQFDGINDYLKIADAPSLNMSGSWSLEAWTKTSASASQTIISKSDSGAYWYLHQQATGAIEFCENDGFNSICVAVGDYRDGNFHQFFVVKNISAGTSNYLLYIDGDLNGTISSSIPSSNISAPVFIGSTGTTEFYNGTIDEIRIYNLTVTGAQINQTRDEGRNLIANRVMHSTMLYDRQNWTVCTTPNNGFWSGQTTCSNNVQITNQGCGLVTGNINILSNIERNGSNCFDLNASNVLINCQGFTIYGNTTTNTYAVNITGVNNVTVENCIFNNFYKGATIQNSENSTLFNNTFRQTTTGLGANHIEISSTGQGHLIDLNSITMAQGGNGITVTAVNKVNVTRNYINNTPGFAASAVQYVNIPSGGGGMIKNNTMENFFSSGASFTSSTGTIIRDNIIRKMSSAGVGFDGSNNNQVINNTMINTIVGVSDDGGGNSNNNTIIGNNISGMSGRFILIGSNAPSTIVENNTFSNATASTEAILVQSNFNNITSNNFNNISVGILVSGSNATFKNNLVMNNNTRYQYNFTTSSSGNYILNQSNFNRSQLILNDTSSVTLQWFADVNVTDTNSNAISNATVSILDLLRTTVFTGLSNANGFVFNITLNQSLINATLETNYTPHNFTANRSSQSGASNNVNINRSQIVNVTLAGIATGCGTINTNTVLTSNIVTTTSVSCITFGSSNIFLNCSGFSISATGSGVGINATTKTGITIRDCIVSNFSQDILLQDTNNSLVVNDTVENATDTGTAAIYILNGVNNSAENNTVRFNSGVAMFFAGTGSGSRALGNFVNVTAASGSGITFATSHSLAKNNFIDSVPGVALGSGGGANITYINNTARSGGITSSNGPNATWINNTISTTSTFAFYTGTGSSGSTLLNNNITASGEALELESNNNNLTLNLIVGGSGPGIVYWGKNSVFINNTFVSNSSSAFKFQFSAVTNNTLVNNTFISNAIGIEFGPGANNSFFNNTLRANTTWITTDSSSSGNNLTATTFENDNGSIMILANATIPVSTNISVKHLNVTFNRAYLNATNLSFLNTSGVIVFRNLTFNSPQAIVDFADSGTYSVCSSTICTNLSFSGGVFVFNTTHFTSFSSNQIGSTCASLTQSLTLTTNIRSNGTCFTFSASNIFLNCAGYNVTGDGTGQGAVAAHKLNITLRDCNFFNFSNNLQWQGTNYSFVMNNTFMNATAQSFMVTTSNNNVWENNTAQSSADNGADIANSNNNTIKNILGTTFSGRGFQLSTSNNNTLINVTGTGAGNFGFLISSSANNTVRNSTGNSDTTFAVLLNQVENSTFSGLTGTSSSSTGIGIFSSLGNVLNGLVGRSTSGAGIQSSGMTNNIIQNSTGISSSGRGISIQSGSNNNNLTNVTGSSSSLFGIYFLTSSNNTLVNSTALSNTAETLYLETTSLNNTFINTTLRGNVSWIFVDSDSGNNTIINTVFDSFNGTIRIIPTIVLANSTNVSINKLNVSFNKAFLNSTNLTYLNTSAEIVLRNLTFTNPQPTVDFTDDASFFNCNQNLCMKNSYSGGILSFNVTHFTIFSSGETTAPNQSTPIVNSTFGTNTTFENLTVYPINATDANNDTVKNITDWRLENRSIALLIMPFEGGSNSTFTRDYSLYGNNGTVLNGAVWNATAGFEGRGAYQFDGINDVIDVSYMNLTVGGSVVLWWKGTDTDAYLVAVRNTSLPVGAGFSYILTSQNAQFMNTTGTQTTVAFTGCNSATDGNWHFVGFTYNAVTTVATTYVDGTSCTTGTVSGGLFDLPATNPVHIGAHPINGHPSNGTIDEILVYNRTLSATQIRALYTNRTDIIVSQELSAGQNWSACVTPNDGFADGITRCSNTVRIVSSCGNITSSYTLANNVGSVGTCFGINASNLTLNCAGFNITGGGSGVGVNVTNKNNITVANCFITNFTSQIYLFNNENSTYENNTLKNGTNGFNAGDSSTKNVVVNNNTILDDTSLGLYVNNGVNITIMGNFINNSGSQGIIVSTVSQSRVTNNTIRISGIGIDGGSFNHNQVEDNTIFHNAANQIGIRMQNGALNDSIRNNTINMSGGTNANTQGISIGTNSVSNMTVFGNHVFGNPGYGILVQQGGGGAVLNNSVEANTVSITGTTGIGITSSALNFVKYNIITGPSSFGIDVEGSQNTTIFNNTINLSQSSGTTAIQLATQSISYNISFNNATANVSLNVQSTNGTSMSVIGFNFLNGNVNFTSAENSTMISNNIFNYQLTVAQTSRNVTSLNTSNLLRSSVSIQDTSYVYLQWYVNVLVLNYSNLPEGNANVNISNRTGGQVYYGLTQSGVSGPEGYTGVQVATEMYWNSTLQFNFTPHNIFVNKTGLFTNRTTGINRTRTDANTILTFIGINITSRNLNASIINPISIPLNKSNLTLGDFSKTRDVLNVTPMGCVEDIHDWNESAQSWFALSSFFNTFGWYSTTFKGDATLVPWMGYYARTNQTQPCTVGMSGNASYPENTAVQLQVNWTLVGWFTPWISPFGDDSQVPNPFTLNQSNYIEIWKRSPAGVWIKTFRNEGDTAWRVGNDTFGNFFNETRPFEAYWIFVNASRKLLQSIP